MKKIFSFLLVLTLVLSLSVVPTATAESDYFPNNYKNAETKILRAWQDLALSVDISDCDISTDMFDDFYNKLFDRNTEYFYVDSSVLYDYNSNSEIVTLKFNYLYNEQEISKKKIEFDKAVDKIISLVPDNASNEYKLLFLYDYLAAYTDYDIKALFDEAEDRNKEIRTAYGCLVNRCCVCQGFSKAFILLCKKIGIEAYSVISEDMAHEWNLVKLGSNYYHIDITYAAPLFSDKNDNSFQPKGYVLHDYFLLSDEQLEKANHYNWTAPFSATDSVTYKNGFWKSVEGIINIFENKAYFVDNGCFIERDLLNGNQTALYSIPDKAYIGEDGLKYKWEAYKKSIDYESAKSTSDYENDRVYFSVCGSIYLFNVKNGSLCHIYSIGESGYIFSLLYDNNLYLTLKNSNKNSNDSRLYTELDNVALSLPNSSALMGDTDGNGKINIADLLQFQKYLCKVDLKLNTDNADVDFDGKINALDYVRLKRIYICRR